jgi:hypothetical protein
VISLTWSEPATNVGSLAQTYQLEVLVESEW